MKRQNRLRKIMIYGTFSLTTVFLLIVAMQDKSSQ